MPLTQLVFVNIFVQDVLMQDRITVADDDKILTKDTEILNLFRDFKYFLTEIDNKNQTHIAEIIEIIIKVKT